MDDIFSITKYNGGNVGIVMANMWRINMDNILVLRNNVGV